MSNLRLKELIVENFRSISGACTIPLDGSITLIHGANGAGKTSILSAIELASTGRVGFLEDQREDTRSFLRNRDFPLGSVRLSLAEDHHATRLGAFELNGDRVTGKAALTPTEQTYFLERSFLPQTALGKLLESYTETEKQVDTALVRFVKSLVGLDDLDALINGLHASGDRRRSKNLIQQWSRATDDLARLQQDRGEIKEKVRSLKLRLDASVNVLREVVGDERSEVDELLSASTLRGRESDTTRLELTRLKELQAAVDAITSIRQRAATLPSGQELQLRNIRAEDAETAFKDWTVKFGEATLSELNRIRQSSLNLPAASIVNLENAYRETIDFAVHADQKYAEAAAADLARDQKIDDLNGEIMNLDRAIEGAEKEARMIEVSEDVRVLVDILQLSIPLTVSDHCPVCDEAFTGTGSLIEHLAAKMGRLSANSNELILIERNLTTLREKRLAKVGQIVLEKSLPKFATGVALDGVVRNLNRLEDAVAEGSRLRKNLQSRQTSVAEATAHAAQSAILEERIAEVTQALGLLTHQLPDQEPELKLSSEITERIQRCRYIEIQLQRERDARQLIEEIQSDLSKFDNQRRSVEKKVTTLQEQLSLAEARMTSSREVLQIAQRTRSKLINEVFDQSLNSLWAQLFGRFAPSERFTPRFVKQTESSRSVDVRLETELPDGQTAGSPGAMLSYGNTNSAALSLFMALHLSAPSDLKWLIFDDPVQSMDDIHVANFAAIVRQLAFVHQRQVIIAIHQPELFDYLSLALAPSDEHHSLVRVTLDRGTGTTTSTVDRVHYAEEPPIRQHG